MPERRIEYVALDDLPDAPTNPKRHATDVIGKSIARLGFVEPIVVDERTGKVIAGHGRRNELRRLHAEGQDAPDGVTVVDGQWLAPVVRGWSSSDDAEAEAAGVALNRVGEVGGWDDRELIDTLNRLAATPMGFDGLGYDKATLEELIERVNKKDPWNDRDFRPLPDARGLESGEVWDVGPHRLVIGDATDPANWAVLPQAQLVVMDPPYGIEYGGGGGLEREAIDGDTPDAATAALEGVSRQIVERCEPGAAVYTFLPPGEMFPHLTQVLVENGLYRWHLVWVKNNATFGQGDYHFQHENVIYGWTEAPRRLRPVENRKLTSVWHVDRPSASKDHPTAKPVEVLSIPIEASSRPGDVVMDPFAGSGSTLVAAATLGRIGCGIELRPEYARVTLDRLEAIVGVPPTKADA